MKGAQPRLTIEPEVQSGDVGIPDECFRIETEDLGFEVRQHAHGAVPARAADDRLDARIEPHAHEVLRAALVFLSKKAPEGHELRIGNDLEAGALQRFHSPRQPSRARRIRRRDDADRITFDERWWPEEGSGLQLRRGTG